MREEAGWEFYSIIEQVSRSFWYVDRGLQIFLFEAVWYLTISTVDENINGWGLSDDDNGDRRTRERIILGINLYPKPNILASAALIRIPHILIKSDCFWLFAMRTFKWYKKLKKIISNNYLKVIVDVKNKNNNLIYFQIKNTLKNNCY